MEALKMNEYEAQILAIMKEEIIDVLLRLAREKGRLATMRPFNIGKRIGTYRPKDPLEDDRYGRVHHKLLRKLRRENRVEFVWNESGTRKTREWRLTEAEYNRLTFEK